MPPEPEDADLREITVAVAVLLLCLAVWMALV